MLSGCGGTAPMTMPAGFATLLEYNREHVVNLRTLKEKLL
jgi:hypothetical protein